MLMLLIASDGPINSFYEKVVNCGFTRFMRCTVGLCVDRKQPDYGA